MDYQPVYLLKLCVIFVKELPEHLNIYSKHSLEKFRLRAASRRSQVAVKEEEKEMESVYPENEIPAHRETSNIEYSVASKKSKIDSRSRKHKRKWTDDETCTLIHIWINYELLYNSKHNFYYNKPERSKAILKMKQQLAEQQIYFECPEILEKMTNLRNYYSAQKRLETSSEKNGAATAELFVSKWKFFSQLDFLANNLIPRNTSSKVSSSVSANSIENSTYNVDSEFNERSQNNAEVLHIRASKELMGKTMQPLDQIQLQKSASTEPPAKSEDDLFCELLGKILNNIPECPEKDIVKIEIQQKLVSLKHSVSSRHITESNQSLH